MPRPSLAVLLALCLAGGITPTAQAQDAREALALGLLRFEYALRDAPLPPAAVASVNRSFDRITLSFFAGRMEQSLASLDSLTGTFAVPAARRAQHTTAAIAALREATARVEVLDLGGSPLSVMMHVPRGATGPRPLIVALHGAGGDERMFFTAYGAGWLREIADRVGAVVVTPNTTQLGLRAELFPALIDAVARRHPIDPTRIVVVGHSMGAGVAARLASLHPTRIRAVACIAGPCGTAVAGGPRRLIVAGSLDPLAPPARLRPSVDTDPSLVSYREATDWGHTLLVAHVLDDVVGWLLEESVPPPNPRSTP